MSPKFPKGTISIRPNLWHNWMMIALQAEARSKKARSLADDAGDPGLHLGDETHEAMIAVTATRAFLAHVRADWKPYLGSKLKDFDLPALATIVPDDDSDLAAWTDSVEGIILDRNQILHVPQKSTPAVPHPRGTNTSELDANFTCERATSVVDRVLAFYERVISSPTPALEQWAESHSHTVEVFREARAKYAAEG